MKQTLVLVVLDGWGLGPEGDFNPMTAAQPECLASLAKRFPLASLQASGPSVGLPWGEVGNSEVGHLTLGAGRVVYQYFLRITMAIHDKTFYENSALKGAFTHAKKTGGAVHLVGLITKGTVHASLDHLKALLQFAEREGTESVRLHLFADGKDSPPRSLQELLREIPSEKIASVIGRYYAMNRNRNWHLTERAYACLLGADPLPPADLDKTVRETYEKGLSDEFLPPVRLNPDGVIRANDAVIFFNFREDSMRQIIEPFALQNFDKFPAQRPENLYIATMTRYGSAFDVPVAFPPETIENSLGEVLCAAEKTQLRLAETYKYAHITYFFNGHRDKPFPNEYRVLIPSLNVAHPDKHPELAAPLITDRLLEALQNRAFDFILVNYANPDTIAHTGNYEACVEAVRATDRELSRVVPVVLETNAYLLITSDHGNVEEVLNPKTGERETQHDANPVPFYLIGKEFEGRRFANSHDPMLETLGILSDVAPTALELMHIPQPNEMNGRSLLQHLLP